MSANPAGSVFYETPSPQTGERKPPRPEVCSLWLPEKWTPESFAKEQMLGLVRQVFFANTTRPVRQVVLSAVEAETDVSQICREMGDMLALETFGSVVVVGRRSRFSIDEEASGSAHDFASQFANRPLRRIATLVRSNLWLAPSLESNGASVTAASLHSYLGEIRREFEYSIVEARPAGESNETTALAQFADGIILVLSAMRTRRATALKAKEMLERAHARLLGTVLTDRSFRYRNRSIGACSRSISNWISLWERWSKRCRSHISGAVPTPLGGGSERGADPLCAATARVMVRFADALPLREEGCRSTVA